MNRILFCNIAYMQYYDFDIISEVPKHGGKYVTETGDAFEKHNFHICEDNYVRGFVETKYREGQPRQIRIENIDSNFINSDCIKDVTVVFCAHSDSLKNTVIVGWYKNATVYRSRPKYNNRQFNLECAVEDAYLISEQQRTFIVPRAKNGNYGFGQSNIWYAKDERASEFITSVIEYIETNSNYSLSIDDFETHKISEEYKESGIGKKIYINKYERNSTARRKCLDIHGTNCLICGFNSTDIYGEEFSKKIEVHHIVPIHKINNDYKVNPETDLIPVCPNCHMILHTKMNSGEFPSLDWLKKHVKKKK